MIFALHRRIERVDKDSSWIRSVVKAFTEFFEKASELLRIFNEDSIDGVEREPWALKFNKIENFFDNFSSFAKIFQWPVMLRLLALYLHLDSLIILL